MVFQEIKPNMYREIHIAVPDIKDISKAIEAFIQTTSSLFGDERSSILRSSPWD
ncbi:hypothetical protein ABE099_06605 [Paenibacillus turicensis]|uniref:hypothetical protein n=1 Tax=Paenibacillus turicensis TaxID=160487 RepID=UPI003D27A81D